ncbi:MAG: asparaginase domain-containing protein [Candidatus Binatia bacterium]|nr:asparaginase domain-containing protein [Candidatus Binatia bacterium]
MMRGQPKGHFLLVATGGTISMLQDVQTGRSVSRRTAADLLALVSARIGTEVRTLDFSLPHQSYAHPDELLALVRLLQGEMVADLRGIVVTHGTDTLEEVAYLIDEILGTRVPLVCTGAMRPGWAPGFDGTRNLDNAFRLVQVAPADYGVLVTMHDDIFEAWSLSKADTGALDAFVARRGAACGRIVGDVVELAWRPVPRPRFGQLPLSLPAPIPILALGVADDAACLAWIPTRILPGLVVTTVGAGSIPPDARRRILTLAEQGVAVVLCANTRGGRTAEEYYYPGAYDDLRAAGVAIEDRLSPRKARIRLMLSLALHLPYVPFGREFVAAPDDARCSQGT